jgi:hypothetical protein
MPNTDVYVFEIEAAKFVPALCSRVCRNIVSVPTEQAYTVVLRQKRKHKKGLFYTAGKTQEYADNKMLLCNIC